MQQSVQRAHFAVAELFAVAFLGGLITGVSPCIVPVLPVVLASGSTGTSRARPFLIIAGLVLSFSLAELLGSAILSALQTGLLMLNFSPGVQAYDFTFG